MFNFSEVVTIISLIRDSGYKLSNSERILIVRCYYRTAVDTSRELPEALGEALLDLFLRATKPTVVSVCLFNPAYLGSVQGASNYVTPGVKHINNRIAPYL